MFVGLQNDHKLIMKQIEEGLHQLHAANKRQKDQEVRMDTEEASKPEADIHTIPFARVDKVDLDSPASSGVCKTVCSH